MIQHNLLPITGARGLCLTAGASGWRSKGAVTSSVSCFISQKLFLVQVLHPLNDFLKVISKILEYKASPQTCITIISEWWTCISHSGKIPLSCLAHNLYLMTVTGLKLILYFIWLQYKGPFRCWRYGLSDLTPFCFPSIGEVEDELLHTYTKVYTFDSLLLSVRLAVLVAVTLTVPLVLFPVSNIAEIRANPYTVTECDQHTDFNTEEKQVQAFYIEVFFSHMQFDQSMGLRQLGLQNLKDWNK